jgi:hypothetical protein
MCCLLDLISFVAVIILAQVLVDTLIPYYQGRFARINECRLVELADILIISQRFGGHIEGLLS